MPLMIPARPGFLNTTPSTTTTSSAGTTITSSTTANTKGSWTQLIADTGARALGILIALDNTAVSNTNTSQLLDIGIGASSSETVLIPDLASGYLLNENVSNTFSAFYFPIFIPANSRLSARMQAAYIASGPVADTVNCRIHLFQRPQNFGWVGTRVTAYGVDSANSKGTNVTHGNSTYGTAGQLTASTTNPIKYMQIGMQGGADASLTDYRVLAEIRLGASTGVAGPLMGSTDTGTESVLMSAGNMTLARMGFNLPAGRDLRVAGMCNGTTNNVFDYIIYGVD
jgi:hypothetical protein